MASSPGSVNYDNDPSRWVIIGAACLTNVIIMGNVKALGVLLIAIENDFSSHLWLIGWIATLYSMLKNILGIGTALCGFANMALIASCFKDRYALANALSSVGLPVGMIVMGPVTQILLDTYGWRGATLLLGGVSFHLVAFGAFMTRDRSSSNPKQYQEVAVINPPEGDEDHTDAGNEDSNKMCFCRNLITVLDFTVLTNVRFILLTVARCFADLSYTFWVVYMVSYGQFQGLSHVQSSLLPTAFGAGNVLGKILAPLLQQVGIKPTPLFWACSGGSLLGVLFITVAFIEPFAGLMITTFLIGSSEGIIFLANDVITRTLSLDDRIVNILGWQLMFSGSSGIMGGLIGGLIYEWTGSFKMVFLLFSSFSFLSIPLYLIDAAYVKNKTN